MTKQEFLFEHDEALIADLINRHFIFHGAVSNDEKEVKVEEKSAREFFSF